MTTRFLRDFIWDTFENTGDIGAYVFFREIEGKKDDVSAVLTDDNTASINNLGGKGNF